MEWGILLTVLSCQLTSSHATTLLRRDLTDYDLAKCNDGSPAAYYYQQEARFVDHLLIYLPDGGECLDVESCRERCGQAASTREQCSAPQEQVIERFDAIWSEDPLTNPFANHFKVMLHYCSSDNYAGTRGASRSTGGTYFHGKHILNSLLQDLSIRFGLERASSLTLVGTGSGAKGVGYNCDYVASRLPGVRVRCIADSPDIVPWWVKTDDCRNRDLEAAEAEKILWGREDDESCVEENKGVVNSSELAHKCGVWSRYWPSVDTPFFLVGSQFDAVSFDSNPCTPDREDPEFDEYELAWRRGTLALYESILAGRSDRGWFVPDCLTRSYLAGPAADSIFARLTVQDIDNNKNMSLADSITNWIETSADLTKTDRKPPPHAIDSLVSGNLQCQSSAQLCSSGCHGTSARDYGSYPRVRRRLLPPGSLFPRGYDRRCCLDPGYVSGTGYGYSAEDAVDTILRRGYSRGIGGVGLGGVGLGGVGLGGGGLGDVGVGRGVYADSGRRSRLWRKVLYLRYLKELYRRQKTDYARDFYGSVAGYPGRGVGGGQPTRCLACTSTGTAGHRGGSADRDFYGLTGINTDIGFGTGLRGRGRIPDLSITDLLGDYDYYDDYDDYGGLLARIRNAVRLRKKNRGEEGEEKGEKVDSDEDLKEVLEDFDFEDFGPLTEKFQGLQQQTTEPSTK